MSNFTKTINTSSGDLYAIGSQSSINSYIEIGYYDKEGNMIPLAAVEVKGKELTGKEVNPIVRQIYNIQNPDHYKVEVVD